MNCLAIRVKEGRVEPKPMTKNTAHIPREDLFQKAMSDLAEGNLAGALKAFEAFLELNPDHVAALLEVGMLKEKLGEKEVAEDYFKKVGEKNPNLYVELYKEAEKFVREQMNKQALEVLQKVGKILPQDPIPHHMVAILYQDLGIKDLAEKFLKKSLEITPTPESYGQLAALYEKSSQLNDAWAISNLGLRMFPDNPHLVLTLARVERRAKKYDQAMARLLAIAGKTGDPILEGQIGFQLGWLYDHADNVDEAFARYVGAKKLAAANAAPDDGDKNVAFEYIKAMKALDLGALPNSPYKPGKDEPKSVAFLVGFPRSGTTLLNQILDAHPDLVSMEEAPTLPGPAEFVDRLPGGYPAALRDLDENTIAEMRSCYFQGVRNFCDFKADSIVIDKLPLNLVHLPLIWTMFPEAKIILALRHPFGSALSNFMHNFKMNNAMANMFSLEDITKFYAAVMDLWQHFKSAKDFAFHEIKYEDVVTNIQAEAEKICKFLEVDWSPEMLAYSKHARAKGLINTPSYHQVTRPLYSDSLERWRRYEKHLAPYHKSLEPFCKYFGYTL